MASGIYVNSSGTGKEVGGGVSFDDIYPVGSVYITVGSTLPAAFKGTWVQLANGVSLGNTTTASQLGTTLAGSAPNITGYVYNPNGTIVWSTPNNSSGGALYGNDYTSGLWSEPTGAQAIYNGYRTLAISAANSSSVYNANAGSNVVRPTSIGVTMWKRTA